MRRGRAIRALALAALALTAVGGGATAVAAPEAPLSHAGRWITDADGRVVILRGWNMVYKVGSYRPADAGFGADDARFLARHGFNTIRLGLIPKGIEPRLPGADGRPRYRQAYLDSVAASERTLAREGIFTLLDFHQDLYNERFEGEGFPDWAVVGDARTLPAQPRQGFPANYLVMAALNRAFDHFWANDRAADGRRLQTSFGRQWQAVVERFRSADHVLGYNLLNEPWPGSRFASCLSPTGCPAFDRTSLEPFSERTIAAIRARDRRKLVWYAPLLTFDFGADSAHGDTGDPRAGFAFNMYCLAGGGLGGGPPPGGEASCDTGYRLTLDNAERQSRETGDALLMTEFGATDDLETIEKVVELADRRMISWQQWHYCACDDPTTTADPVSTQALVPDPRRAPAGGNVKAAKLAVSERAYPQAVSGTPLSFDFDRGAKRFDLSYSTRRADGGGAFAAGSQTEVFVPRLHYSDGYRVDVAGARVTSAPGAQTLRLRSCPGSTRVTVRVVAGEEAVPRSCPVGPSGGTEGDDVIIGTPGDDVIRCGSGDDRVDGGGGDDRIECGAGDDVVEGGVGDDAIRGGSGHDELDGGPGSDRLSGESGDDRIDGGEGTDRAVGGSGRDDVTRVE